MNDLAFDVDTDLPPRQGDLSKASDRKLVGEVIVTIDGRDGHKVVAYDVDGGTAVLLDIQNGQITRHAVSGKIEARWKHWG